MMCGKLLPNAAGMSARPSLLADVPCSLADEIFEI